MLQDEKDKPLTVEGVVAELGITEEEYATKVLEEQSARLGEGVSPYEMMMKISEVCRMERAMGR
ncbi:MAG: hypothetical protein WCX17_02710 [Parcubacteria group bacterium]|jgi:hypothetical protein